MSWVSDYNYSWLETAAMNFIKAGGHLPYHIAFVMDGNRRYASSQHIRKIEGHSKGFDRLADCLRWCLDMGIREVTTFAFSIENFKRSEDEVNSLLNLAREKFLKLLEETKQLQLHGVCIRVIGNLNLLPPDLQNIIAQAVLNTEKNNKLFLNVAFSYTSRDEITQAVEAVLKYGDNLKFNDINERLLAESLYTRNFSSPDLLYRTSGETRISDFLMWQLQFTVLYFTKILWPEITLWNFLGGLFSYQRSSLHMEHYKRRELLERAKAAKWSTFFSDRVQTFLQHLDIFRKNYLLQL